MACGNYTEDLRREKPKNAVGTIPMLSVVSIGLANLDATGSECSTILTKQLMGLLILTVFLSVTVFGCAPDFTQPGDRGGKTPAELSVNREVWFDSSQLPPLQAACGQTYSVAAVVFQRLCAPCGSYNYRPFYERAIAAADYILAPINCPAECAPKHTWIESRGWLCLDPSLGVLPTLMIEKKLLEKK